MMTKRTLYTLSVITLSILFAFLSLTLLERTETTDTYDLSVEVVLMIFSGALMILFQKFNGSSAVYLALNTGLSLTYLAYATDVLDEMCVYPRFLQYILDDAGHIVAMIYIAVGVVLWIKENNSMISRLQAEATTDHLTQIPNRHYFSERLNELCHTAERYSNSFSMIVFDIDYFKVVNDRFGHQVGDRVLYKMATLIRSQIRDADVVARYGGEEFVILLPETNLQGAVATAEKLRLMVELNHFETVRSVTASFGVAEYKLGETGRELFERADQNLYRAKEAGRNQVFPSAKSKRTTVHKLYHAAKMELCAMTL